MRRENVYTKGAAVREVGVRELRAELRRWLDHVRRGGEVVVTERGRPVARIVGAVESSRMQELVDAGVITLPSKPKEYLTGPGIKARGSVSEYVLKHRR